MGGGILGWVSIIGCLELFSHKETVGWFQKEFLKKIPSHVFGLKSQPVTLDLEDIELLCGRLVYCLGVLC